MEGGSWSSPRTEWGRMEGQEMATSFAGCLAVLRLDTISSIVFSALHGTATGAGRLWLKLSSLRAGWRWMSAPGLATWPLSWPSSFHQPGRLSE